MGKRGKGSEEGRERGGEGGREGGREGGEYLRMQAMGAKVSISRTITPAKYQDSVP
jgi:hypothetical protein